MERKTKELNFLKHFLWKNLVLTDFFPNFGLSNKKFNLWQTEENLRERFRS